MGAAANPQPPSTESGPAFFAWLLVGLGLGALQPSRS
jgi:hypothetical protein